MKALILAAGLGKRMRPLTNDIPKAMVLVKKKPLLEHVLRALKNAGIEECVIVIGHLKEKIIERFRNEFEGMKLHYMEQKELNGTAGAIALGKGFFKEDFIVCNADVIVPEKYLLALKEKKGFDAVLLVREEKNPERFGVVEIDEKKKIVLGLEEKPYKAKSNLVNAGAYKFSEQIFDMIACTKKNELRGEYEITDTIKLMLKEKRKIGFIKCEEKILDIGSLDDLKKANQ